jgi:hypothetical protein
VDCMRPFLRDRSTTAEVWHGPMRPHSPLAVLDWKDCSGVLDYRLDCAGGDTSCTHVVFSRLGEMIRDME